jgi:EAL and modified HD-GYP domain-containing signal transduction protein
MAPASFPLVEIRSVANAQNEWVALLLRAPEGGLDDVTLQAMFGAPDLLPPWIASCCWIPRRR